MRVSRVCLSCKYLDQRVSSVENAKQFDFEVQGRVGRNGRWIAFFSIAQLWWHFQFNHPTFTKQLQSFGPAGYDLGKSKAGRGTLCNLCQKCCRYQASRDNQLRPCCLRWFALGRTEFDILNLGGCCELSRHLHDQHGARTRRTSGRHAQSTMVNIMLQRIVVCFISILCRSKRGFDSGT